MKWKKKLAELSPEGKKLVFAILYTLGLLVCAFLFWLSSNKIPLIF